MTLVGDRAAQGMTGAAMAAVRVGDVRVQAPTDSLAPHRAKVYTVAAANTTYTSVTIPVGGEVSRLSNLTVLFDQSGHVVQYGETLIGQNDAGNFTIRSFTDGAFVGNSDTGVPFLTDAQLQRTDRLAASSKGSDAMVADNTAACVASVLGVSGVTAYLIVGACTGACAVPGVGTAVCVACIGAYATVGGASIAAVASCFR